MFLHLFPICLERYMQRIGERERFRRKPSSSCIVLHSRETGAAAAWNAGWRNHQGRVLSGWDGRPDYPHSRLNAKIQKSPSHWAWTQLLPFKTRSSQFIVFPDIPSISGIQDTRALTKGHLKSWAWHSLMVQSSWKREAVLRFWALSSSKHPLGRWLCPHVCPQRLVGRNGHLCSNPVNNFKA